MVCWSDLCLQKESGSFHPDSSYSLLTSLLTFSCTLRISSVIMVTNLFYGSFQFDQFSPKQQSMLSVKFHQIQHQKIILCNYTFNLSSVPPITKGSFMEQDTLHCNLDLQIFLFWCDELSIFSTLCPLSKAELKNKKCWLLENYFSVAQKKTGET